MQATWSWGLSLIHGARCLPHDWVPNASVWVVGCAQWILDFRNLSLAMLRVSSVFPLNFCVKAFQPWVFSPTEVVGAVAPWGFPQELFHFSSLTVWGPREGGSSSTCLRDTCFSEGLVEFHSYQFGWLWNSVIRVSRPGFCQNFKCQWTMS